MSSGAVIRVISHLICRIALNSPVGCSVAVQSSQTLALNKPVEHKVSGVFCQHPTNHEQQNNMI